MKKFIILALLFAVLMGFLIHFGLLEKVTFTEEKVDSMWIVYETHQGSYTKAGPIMDRLYYALSGEDNVETTKGFGLYFDNPKNVSQSELRSLVGCVLEEKDIERVEELRRKYKVIELPPSQSLVCRMPYKGFPSIILGVFKVYPQILKYKQIRKYSLDAPIMEIYDTPNKVLLYNASLDVEKKVYESYWQLD